MAESLIAALALFDLFDLFDLFAAPAANTEVPELMLDSATAIPFSCQAVNL